MLEFISSELDLKLNLPDGWIAIENRSLFADYIKLSAIQIENTAFLLIKYDENNAKRIIRVYHNHKKYSTLWEYFFDLSHNTNNILSDNAVKLNSIASVTNSGIPFYHIMVKFRSGNVTSFNHVYHKNISLCFAAPIITGITDSFEREVEQIVSSI